MLALKGKAMETRLSLRVNAKLKIISKISEGADQRVKFAKSDSFEAETCDINTLGVSLVIKKYLLPKGLKIDLSIDGTPFGLKKEMKVKGEIRYCKNLKVGAYKCGVKFINLPKEYKDAITRFTTPL